MLKKSAAKRGARKRCEKAVREKAAQRKRWREGGGEKAVERKQCREREVENPVQETGASAPALLQQRIRSRQAANAPENQRVKAKLLVLALLAQQLFT